MLPALVLNSLLWILSAMDFSITDTRVLQICLCEFCYRHPGYSLFKVYNVTRFLKYHPGRKAQLMRGAGVDCTELFDKAPRI
jgi:hypothetical protein